MFIHNIHSRKISRNGFPISQLILLVLGLRDLNEISDPSERQSQANTSSTGYENSRDLFPIII